MFAWSPRSLESLGDEPTHMRRSAQDSFRILRITDVDALWARIASDVAEWLDPSAVRAFRLGADGVPTLTATSGADEIPFPALQMELALLGRSLARGRSLISNHPALDADLESLGSVLAASDSVVHILLLRAHQETHGLVAVHWHSRQRPGYERRSGFLPYWDNAGLAVANAHERFVLHRTAFVDALTGLPNQRALEAELERRADTHPLGVLVLDFDGMRAANAAFENDYARGGDVLIVAVAHALQLFAGDADLPARMHTRGDEFCLIMPGSDQAATARRCDELQELLDGLVVPESHRHVYRGASVGGAARLGGEAAAETLARASRAMHERKAATRSR